MSAWRYLWLPSRWISLGKRFHRISCRHISWVYLPLLRTKHARGGKTALDPVTNVRSLQENQLRTDRAVSALLANWKNGVPLVLILGSECRAAPVPHHNYGVDFRAPFLTDIVSWIGFA